MNGSFSVLFIIFSGFPLHSYYKMSGSPLITEKIIQVFGPLRGILDALLADVFAQQNGLLISFFLAKFGFPLIVENTI